MGSDITLPAMPCRLHTEFQSTKFFVRFLCPNSAVQVNRITSVLICDKNCCYQMRSAGFKTHQIRLWTGFALTIEELNALDPHIPISWWRRANRAHPLPQPSELCALALDLPTLSYFSQFKHYFSH